MPDDLSLVGNDREGAIAAISELIYETLVSIQKQHPYWLTQQYRRTAWGIPQYRSVLTEKLTKEFSQIEDDGELLQKVKNHLQIILVPEFVNSPEYKTLIAEINRLINPQIADRNLINSLLEETSQNGVEAPVIGIAVLLLDVENLQLDLKTEKFLENVCTYPIQIKVAFANWRSMGKKDLEFHQRGYQLIHVPAGKDSADLKMATVGASIFVHYPTAKEVLVCSSDRALIHLGNTLQSHGLTVYQVRKELQKIIVLNSQTGESKTHAIGSKVAFPSVEEFIVQLQQLIKQEIRGTGIQWISLDRISALYQETYNFTLDEVVSVYFPGSPTSSIFVNHPANFALHQPDTNAPVYVTIFELEKNRKLGKQYPELTGNISEVNSVEKMDIVLVKIINKLTKKSKNTYVLTSNVASEFKRIYGKPITEVIRQVSSKKKIADFLPLCSSLRMNKAQNGQIKVAVIEPSS